MCSPSPPVSAAQLADFGLAKIFGSPQGRLTNQVFARWYRAPELLFGAPPSGRCASAAAPRWKGRAQAPP